MKQREYAGYARRYKMHPDNKVHYLEESLRPIFHTMSQEMNDLKGEIIRLEKKIGDMEYKNWHLKQELYKHINNTDHPHEV